VVRYRAEQVLVCFRIDFRAGGLKEIAYRSVCFRAPNSIRRPIIKALAAQFALNICDQLDTCLGCQIRPDMRRRSREARRGGLLLPAAAAGALPPAVATDGLQISAPDADLFAETAH